MFEDMVISAVQMLIIMFWAAIAFMVIWGALWLRSVHHIRKED